MAKLVDVAVLNTTAGATDAVVAKGNLSLAAAATDAIGAIPMKDVLSWTNTAYSAGVLADDEVQFAATPAAGTYSITVEDNDEKRTYSVTYAAATTGATVVADLIAEFAKYAGSVDYQAVAGATVNDLDVRMLAAGINNGGTSVSSVGGTVTNSTPYTAPSGNVAEISKLTPKVTLAGGQYTKHSIIWNKLVSHNAVSGLKVYREVETVIYSEENMANFAALEAEIDSILEGSYIAAIGDVADYLGR